MIQRCSIGHTPRQTARGADVVGRIVACALLAMLVLGSERAAAERQTVYRCVGSDGSIALQEQPCGDRQAQTRREFPRTADSPPALAAPPAATPAQDPPANPGRTLRAGPPPALWQCVDFDGKVQYQPQDRPNGRWVPAWVLGVDPRAPARMFSGREGQPAPRPPADRPGLPASGEIAVPGPMLWVEDVCRQLDPRATCAIYRQQADEAEQLRYNRTGDDQRAAAAELNRLRAIIVDYCP